MQLIRPDPQGPTPNLFPSRRTPTPPSGFPDVFTLAPAATFHPKPFTESGDEHEGNNDRRAHACACAPLLARFGRAMALADECDGGAASDCARSSRLWRCTGSRIRG